MKKIWIIAQKEISFYLNNPIGYIIAVLFFATSLFFFFNDFFVVGIVSMQNFFALAPWLLLFFVAGLTMRGFSEEKRQNTLEVLLTLPVYEYEIVVGKFLGLAILLGCTLLMTFIVPVSLLFLGPVQIGEILVNYIGIYLFGLQLIAIGLFISLFTNNQVVSLLVTLIVTLMAIIAGTDSLTRYVPNFIGSIITYLSPLYQVSIFSRGVVALRSVFYFLSTIGLFLSLATLLLQKRNE